MAVFFGLSDFSKWDKWFAFFDAPRLAKIGVGVKTIRRSLIGWTSRFFTPAHNQKQLAKQIYGKGFTLSQNQNDFAGLLRI